MQQPCTSASGPCAMRCRKRHSACVVVIDLGFPGHFPHFGGHDEEATVMRGLILGLIWLAAGVAQADVYISIDAKGGYVLTNVHRPGRHYEKVINEPLAQAGPANAQMITGRPYAELVAAAARAHNVPPALLHALIKAESGYNPKARSSAGPQRPSSAVACADQGRIWLQPQGPVVCGRGRADAVDAGYST